MKKIYLFSAIAIVAMTASCQKTGAPSVEPVMNISKEISFGVSELNATKAVSGTTIALMETNGFNVAGLTSDATMFNELASKVAGSDPVIFKTANTYYWPATGTMDFYACYPSSETITINSGVATIEYTQDDTKDLVVAKKTNHTVGADVALAFSHALAQINFTAKGSDASVTYKLTKIVVQGVSSGTYAYASDNWTRGSSTTDMTFLNTSTDISTSAATTITGDATFVPGAVQITADWDTYIGTSKIASYTASTAAITAGTAISLEQGKKNTINLTLPNSSASEIQFSITLNDWGTASQDVTLK